ncbi:MAG: tetratricopeptide repeat protein [Desulfobacterales bacterium]
MDRFQTTTLPKPAVGELTFSTSRALSAGSFPAAANNGMLSKFIQQQVHGADNHQVRELRRQVSQAVFALKTRCDRVIEENQRMAQSLDDLQRGQKYLVAQLARHQQREELAILREQQDGQRIRELENRLSLLLLAPLQDQPFTITAPEAHRIAICQAAHFEPAAEEPQGPALTPAPEQNDPAPEDAAGDAGRAGSQDFPASDDPCVASPADDLAREASSTDELDTLGEVPSLAMQPAEMTYTHADQDQPNQAQDLEATVAAVAADDGAPSDIIDLLNEVDTADKAHDPLPDDMPAVEAKAPDGRDTEDIAVDETIESSSLNTNYVLEAPRGTMLATETADPLADDMPVELDAIITLLDEIHSDRPAEYRASSADPDTSEGPEPTAGSTPPGAEEPVAGESGGVSDDRFASEAVEDCLENIEDAATNTFEVIDLKEEAIIERAPERAELAGSDSTSGPAPVPAAEAAGKKTEETGGLPPQSKGKTARAKVLFGQGKLACQRKDYVKAIDFFTRFLELTPDDPRGSYNLAILHYRMKDYRQASTHARKALDLGYTNAEHIMAKITLKSAPAAAAEAGGGMSVADALLETETVHHMTLTADVVPAEDRQATVPGAGAKPADNDGELLRHAVLEDDLLDLSSGAALDPLLNDETALIEPAGSMVVPSPRPAGAMHQDDGAAAKRLFVDGMRAYRKKDFRTGLEHFSRFTTLRPHEAKGHYNLAILHYRLKDYPQALTCARRAQDLGAGAARKIVKKIESKTARLRAAGVLAPVGPALGTPNNPPGVSATENHADTGLADTASIWGADELEEEINQALFSAAVDDTPDGRKEDEMVFDARAEDESESAAKTAAGPVVAMPQAEDPDGDFQNERLKNIFELGRAAVENKDYLKAIQHFSKVTRLVPDDPRGYYHLADVSFRLRFYETAREHATRAIELGSTAAKNIMSQIVAHQLPA